MNFAPPPSFYSDLYNPKPAAPVERPPPKLNHSFEDPVNLYDANEQPLQTPYAVPPQQQPQPVYQQQQPQQTMTPAGYDYYGQQQQQQVPAPGYPTPYQQPPPQSMAAAAPPPMQTQPQQQQQPHNPDMIALCPTHLIRQNERHKFLDHPSIPRLLPHHIDAELEVRARAPAYINPTRRVTLRPTFATFPATSQLAESLQLPFGFTLSPFAEEKLPEVDFTEVGNRMIRCRKCAAYINPFTTFCDGGRRWQCILCSQMNDTMKEYYSPLDQQTGLRQDIMNRPELLNCSVDFYPTAEFLRRPPHRPIQLLMLDCSYPAVASGLLAAMCRGALSALESMKEDDAMHMGVVGFDSTVYFFNLRPTLGAPRMMASPDTVNDICNVNDSFKLDPVELPCSINELIVPVKDSYRLLKELFEQLPTVFVNTKEVGCAFGPALAASISMLQSNGGKIITSLASMPSVGEGKLKPRFDPSKLSNQPKEYTMCAAANDWYKQRALACSNCSISIDIFASGSTDLDLTTVAPLARYTSGSIFRATSVTINGVAEQIERSLLRFIAFDCILRVRTSSGLIVPNFFGHCHVREPDLLALPIANQDSSYSIEFKVGPNFKGNYAYAQFALVYTTRARERRIRVHTVQIPVSNSTGAVINSASSIGMGCFLTKMAVDYAVNGPFPQAQQKVTDKLVAALKVVRRCAATQGIPGAGDQLLLPESMKFVPQIVHGFFRCAATGMATTRPIPPDERVASMAAVMSSPPDSVLPFYLGWSYQVYSPQIPLEQLPVQVYSSQSLFTSDGIFVINIGSAIVLWYGKKANPTVVRAFGLQPVDSAGEADAFAQTPSWEDLEALRQRTEALIWQLKTITVPAYAAAVEPCPQGNGVFEPALTRAMTEDEVRSISSYSAYLKTLKQRVSDDSK